ncbi:hypothetical protein CBL_20326 [Carabus blaptoides fortunei]
MKRTFEITIGSYQCYVGMEIRRDRVKKKIYIGQQACIMKLVRKYNLEDNIPTSTPVDAHVKLTSGAFSAGVYTATNFGIKKCIIAVIPANAALSLRKRRRCVIT